MSVWDSLGDAVITHIDKYSDGYIADKFGDLSEQGAIDQQPAVRPIEPQVGTNAAPISGAVSAGDANQPATGGGAMMPLLLIGAAAFFLFK